MFAKSQSDARSVELNSNYKIGLKSIFCPYSVEITKFENAIKI